MLANRTLFLLVVLGGVATVPATAGQAAETRPFTVEDVATYPTIRDLRVSPDGRTAAMMVRSGELEANRYRTRLWVVPVDGSTAARPLTRHPASESQPRWSPDGALVAFLARREDWTQVWALPVRGGEARPLTRHRESVAAFEWAPDGRRLLFLAPEPESEEEGRRRKAGDDAFVVGRHWRNHRAWVVDMRAGGAEPVTDVAYHVQSAAWSPEGRWIAAVTTPTPEADSDEEAKARLVEVATRQVRDVPGGDRASKPSWTADGNGLAFLQPFDARGFSREDLFLWSPGSPAPRNVSGVLDRDIESVRPGRGGRGLAVVHARGVVSGVAQVDPETARVSPLWHPDHSLAALEPAGDGWAYVRGDRPAELWWCGTRGEAPRRVARVDEGPAPMMPRIEALRWKGGAAHEIEGVVFKSDGLDDTRRMPLVVMPHGGPRAHSSADLDLQAAYLASLGFVVLKPNFRGSTGYGDTFAKGNVADWGDGPFGDVMGGVDALVALGVADPDRLFLYGWSYGGYLANWAATHTGRFRAAASGAGVADLRMQYTLSDARRWRFDYMAGSPFEGHLPVYDRLSPITYVRQARVPVLFVHGAADERVPLAQGLMMHRGLLDNGVATELVVYPREGHSFTEPRHVLDRLRRVVEWFRRHDASSPETAGR